MKRSFKIWLVSVSDYEGCQAVRAFTTKRKAESFAASFKPREHMVCSSAARAIVEQIDLVCCDDARALTDHILVDRKYK